MVNFKIGTFNVNGTRDFRKRGFLNQYLIDEEIDVCFIQETHITCLAEVRVFLQVWEGKGYFAFGGTRGRGVGILFRKGFQVKIEKYTLDPGGRFIYLDVDIQGGKFRFCNVYAPNDEKLRKDFIISLSGFLTGNRQVILGGDFNFVEDTSLDKRGGNPDRGMVGKEEMRSVRDDFDLVDVFRSVHTVTTEYTWFSSSVACRLDRFYISRNDLSMVQSIAINAPAPHISDHAMVHMSLAAPDSARGPGYWKCNSKILEERDFISQFTTFWSDLIAQEQHFTRFWWDGAKLEIKNFLVQQSKIRSKQNYIRLKDLQAQLALYKDFNLINIGEFDGKIKQLETQIRDFETEKLEGSKIRSRVNVLVHSEKPTKFFLSMEHKRGALKSITSLIDRQGQRVDSQEGILRECEQFYRELFEAEPIDQGTAANFLGHLPQLPDFMAESLEAPITEEECLIALSRMQNNKSPGKDGLTKEFYIKVFPIISKQYQAVINDIFNSECLSPSQRHGLITLACKDRDNAEFLKNWRPISLLNVDYKIISKVLSIRLGSVLANIIHFDQTCAVPGRSILDNCHLIRNIVDFSTQKQIDLALLTLDQSKAFDRVSFDFLFQALRRFGFRDNFRRWVEILYRDINSSVVVNGHFSRSIPLERGVRQGCSLSPLLYVCFIESFAIAVRRSSLVRGLPLPGGGEEAKISQYADDTTCILRDTASIREVFKISESFSAASGARLNNDKSKGLALGNFGVPSNLPIQWVRKIKICGIWYGDDADRENWDRVLDKFRKAALLHSGRGLTLRGKALIGQVLLCSKLWYVASSTVLGVHRTADFDKVLFSFIWSDGVEKLSRATLYLPFDRGGGLNVVNIHFKTQAFLVKHVLNIINFSDPAPKWHRLALYWIGLPLSKYNRALTSNLTPRSERLSVFYSACLDSFNTYSRLLEERQGAAPPPAKRRRLQRPPQGISGLQDTKFIYKMFNSKTGCIPRVYSSFPHIDFCLSWKVNNLAFLDPFHRNLSFRLIHNILPVKAKLRHIGFAVDLRCPHCGEDESLLHAFCDCRTIAPLWRLLLQFFQRLGFSNDLFVLTGSDEEIKDQIVHNCIPFQVSPASIVCFILIYSLRSVIWDVRCKVLHERENFTTLDIFEKFLNCVKFRIKCDFCILSEREFLERWGGNRDLVRVVGGRLFTSY
jgi:exonuclease III